MAFISKSWKFSLNISNYLKKIPEILIFEVFPGQRILIPSSSASLAEAPHIAAVKKMNTPTRAKTVGEDDEEGGQGGGKPKERKTSYPVATGTQQRRLTKGINHSPYHFHFYICY